MPYKEDQLTLMGFLGMPAVKNIIKTRFIGGPYIRFYNWIEVLSYLYMIGAILGRARRDDIINLAKMFTLPGREEEHVNWLHKRAKERLEQFKTDEGREPDTFTEFILLKELENAGINIQNALEAYTRGDKNVMKAFDEKVPLEKAEPLIKAFGLDGIGFGSFFPELTEKIYRNSFEKVDTEKWAEARAYGLSIPEEPSLISLEEQEAIVLQMVALYAQGYYPELLDPLDLREIIEDEIKKSKGEANTNGH